MPVHNQHGLHARPCASIVSVIAGLDAVVMLRRGDRAPDEAVDGRSIMAVQSLGVRQGDELVATITGRQAHLAHRALAELAAKNFGDGQAEHQPDRVASTLGELPIHELQLTVPVDDYRPGTREEELARLETALANTDGFLEGLAAKMPDQSVTGAVLRAIRSILHDPMLAQGFRDRIAEGRSAVAAVQGTMQDAIAVFETMSNPYLRERGTDLRALQRTLLASLMETEDLSMTGVPAGHLVLVDELDAITASQLDPLAVPGVLTRTSGSNGHGLVVANDRGLTVHLVAAG
ncbi:HPr family phosphocarrier protein [Luteococcus sp. OSA5]|uniref:HPr family phosphocarrier protein n=1 Tax=Luteococcus sp. OSA5 TaxID=3401630 RepID=UPI003B43A16F